VRYERDMPGELIHLDIKKLGRIDGIGHRITGDRTGQSNKRGTGWEYLHVAIDDARRLAYSEVLPSERKQCAIAFTRRALAWFTGFGVSVERIMTDNGSAYKSFAFRNLLADHGIGGAWHSPQTNPTLHAMHQRQGQALHPNQLARIGLRRSLLYLRQPHRRTDTLAEILQHSTHPQRHPPSNALHQTEQPSWIQQLV
jgi:transposase InsO family protein